MAKTITWTLIFIVATGAAVWWLTNTPFTAPPTNHTAPPEAEWRTDSTDAAADAPQVTVIAQDLETPWDIAFLPDGSLLVPERTGTLQRLFVDGSRAELVLPGKTNIVDRGEGGLLGVAVHPEFTDAGMIYVYMTEEYDGQTVNSVWQYWLQNDTLMTPARVITDIPAAANHNGGRLAFGPDGLLYITTGDAGDAASAADLNSLAGKILRIEADGAIPAENFGTAVYSFGHRNPQGLTWDEAGNLWSTEHGRSGLQSGFDELNLIERGANYGWPESQGDTVHEGTRGPAVHSGSRTTWAPAGAAYHSGSIFFGGLRGATLYEAVLDADHEQVTEVKEHFKGEFGRIRAVVVGPDNLLYIATSNRDGRGSPAPADDRIIRINPTLLD